MLLLARDHLLLVVYFAMCFKEVIKQHRVHRVVTHGLEFAVAIASHQIRSHLFHFLGHKAKLRDTLGIKLLFIAEGDRV